MNLENKIIKVCVFGMNRMLGGVNFWGENQTIISLVLTLKTGIVTVNRNLTSLNFFGMARNSSRLLNLISKFSKNGQNLIIQTISF